MNKIVKKASLIGAGALATIPAYAVDITAVSTALAEGATNVQTVGAAVLVIAVAIAVFKWVRKAF